MIVHPLVCRPFVGRRAELAYLHERRLGAAASHGGLVLVCGDAGLGKSRLVAEFCRSLAYSRWRIETAQCLEFAQRPYGPILDVLERCDPRSAEATASSQAERVEQIIGAFGELTARNGLILILEDVHWADAATIELLVHLASRLETMRMLVVATARLEDIDPNHPGASHFAKLARTRIELSALDGADLRAFIDHTLDGIVLGPAIKREIARASDGNPFFIEELLRASVESGDRDAPSSHSAGLPTTIRATLLERVRRLNEAERRILLQAAVVGRSFDLAVLAETLELDVEALLPALQRARELQLVEEESGSVFRFRHALTREAIYGEYLAAQVRPLHRTIALVLERGADPGAAVAQLAYHWWKAGDASRATSYNELAGDEASASHAHDDAIAFYERAMETPEIELARKGRLFAKIAERRLAAGSLAQARTSLLEAAAIFRELGDAVSEARARIAAAKQAYHLGDADAERDLIALLERVDESERLVRNRVNLAIAQIMAAQYRPLETQRHIERVERVEIESDAELIASYSWVRAAMCIMTADADGYRAEHRARLDAARSGSSGETPAHVHSSACYQFELLGLHAESLDEAREALAAARRERNRRVEAVAHAFSAFTYLAMGELANVCAAVDAVRGLPTDNLLANGHAAAWGSLAGAYRDDADLIDYWFDRVETTIHPTAALLYAAGYAEIMVRRGRTQDAQILLHDAIEHAQCARGIFFTLVAVAKHGHPDDFAAARASLAGAADVQADVVERHVLPLFDAYVAQRNGKHAEAILDARLAIAGLHRVGYPLLEAAALELSGDTPAAANLYRRAGAVYDLRRLEGRVLQAVPNAKKAAPSVATALSPREREIASLVAGGQSNLEIGRTLSISHKTVEKHLGTIYAKLGFTSRAQLAAYVSRGSNADVPSAVVHP